MYGSPPLIVSSVVRVLFRSTQGDRRFGHPHRLLAFVDYGMVQTESVDSFSPWSFHICAESSLRLV